MRGAAMIWFRNIWKDPYFFTGSSPDCLIASLNPRKKSADSNRLTGKRRLDTKRKKTMTFDLDLYLCDLDLDPCDLELGQLFLMLG